MEHGAGMARTQRAVTAAADRTVKALRAAVETPSTEANRKAAEHIVALRQLFEHEGHVDWAGRSPQYRDLIERLYRQAKVPPDSESSMQANLRYHLGNVLRKTAPPEDLAALGMAVDGPLGRIHKTRKAAPRKMASQALGTGEPAAIAALALSCVQALSTMRVGPDVIPPLRELIDCALGVITEHNHATDGT